MLIVEQFGAPVYMIRVIIISMIITMFVLRYVSMLQSHA